MRHEFFNEQMDRLRGLRFVPASFDTHWEGLRDMPERVLDAAVGRAIRTRSDFPTPAELRVDADAVKHLVVAQEREPDRGTDLPEPKHFLLVNDASEVAKTITAHRIWRYYCEVCGDSGDRSFWCGASKRQPWVVDATCESDTCRKIRHGHTEYGHEWVRRCECWASNPAVQRRIESQAKYAANSATQKRAS